FYFYNMHFLYIIYSKNIDKYYVGETENPQNRLKQHNEHYFKTNFTKAAADCEHALSFQCDTKEDAVFLERFIKKMKSRKFIEKVVQDPEILNSILKK